MRQIISISLFLLLATAQQVSAQSVDDFDEISAKLDLEFDTQTQRIDDIYNAVDEAIDRAFRGLTKRIEVKWPDGALPERHRWVTYNSSLTSRAVADFETGKLIVETVIEPGENIQEKVAELMAMSSSIATATPEQLDEQDVLLQAVSKEVEEVTDTPIEKGNSTDTSIKNVMPDDIGEQLAGLAQALEQDFSAQPTLSQAAEPQQIVNVIEQLAEKQNVAASKPVSKPAPPASTKTAAPEPQVEATVVAKMQAEAQPEPESSSEPASIPESEPLSEPKPELAKKQEVVAVTPDPKQAPEPAQIPESKPLSEPKPVIAKKQEVVAVTPEPTPFPVPAEMPVLAVVEKDGQTRLQLSIEFVNDYQEKLVSQYFEDIKTYAKQYDVPVSVIMAIIETESSYNPRAVSPIPAFGLMQLVPKTAGLDAHLFVHGEKKIVSADYLFNEDNNLKLGSAYFHLLTHRYLRKISDPEARFYCAVASYNTGVGNVAKTFTGRKSISAAVDTINGMTPQAVYDYLLENLPADETKNYLRKIVTRMEKYQQFDA